MNVNIRNWKISDAKDLSLALNNRKILDNLRDGIPFPYNESDAKQFITSILNLEKDSSYCFAITLDDTAIGSIGVFRKDNIHNQTAEMGYYISEKYWGNGIATIAIKLVCKYIFENTNIIRIFAEPFSTNIASCRVLEKSGFNLEGILRKNAVKNSIVIDMSLYSIIK